MKNNPRLNIWMGGIENSTKLRMCFTNPGTNGFENDPTLLHAKKWRENGCAT